MNKGRIRQSWESYRARVVPRTAHATQIEETRRAFYAGAASLHAIVLNDVAALPDDTAETEMQMIDAEFAEFVEGVRNSEVAS